MNFDLWFSVNENPNPARSAVLTNYRGQHLIAKRSEALERADHAAYAQ